MLNDSFKLRRGCRVSCCCLSKRSRVWRWIRYLLRRNATVRKCWSRTKGKEEDVIHKSGWKLIWKQEKSVGLLTDRLCLVDQVSQKKVLLEERNSRCTLPSRVCLNVSLCYRSTFWLPWSRIPGNHYLLAKWSTTKAKHPWLQSHKFLLDQLLGSEYCGERHHWEPVSQRYCQLLWGQCSWVTSWHFNNWQQTHLLTEQTQRLMKKLSVSDEKM